MARLCSQCKYYTTDAESICPRCNLALQVTFLPPPGQAAAPLTAVAAAPVSAPALRRPRETESSQLRDLFRFLRGNRLVVSTVIGLVAVAGSLLFGWGSRSLEDRYNRIEVGMDEAQVRNLLSPPVRGRRWRSPERHNQPVLSTEGYAVMKHAEPAGTVTVEFMDGQVTRKALKMAESASR